MRTCIAIMSTWLIAAVILVIAAVQSHPYSFYVLLRWISCPIIAYSAFTAYERECVAWAWIFGMLTALYNPLFRVHLDCSTWIGVNWFTIGVIAVAAVAFWRGKWSAAEANQLLSRRPSNNAETLVRNVNHRYIDHANGTRALQAVVLDALAGGSVLPPSTLCAAQNA
jgi:hypothetical protein